jgi:hypothetical protein
VKRAAPRIRSEFGIDAATDVNNPPTRMTSTQNTRPTAMRPRPVPAARMRGMRWPVLIFCLAILTISGPLYLYRAWVGYEGASPA